MKNVPYYINARISIPAGVIELLTPKEIQKLTNKLRNLEDILKHVLGSIYEDVVKSSEFAGKIKTFLEMPYDTAERDFREWEEKREQKGREADQSVDEALEKQHHEWVKEQETYSCQERTCDCEGEYIVPEDETVTEMTMRMAAESGTLHK